MSTDSGTSGRIVRAALIIFPLGLVLLGAGSFVFYFNHKEEASQRAIKYAAGLRRDLNEADLKHYQQVFAETLQKPAAERLKTLTTFLDSTLGPENMGYTVREVHDKMDRESAALAFDVEVTGARKPRDLVVVLTSFIPDLTTMDNQALARPAAVFLNVAHSLAGQAKVRSIRFVAVQSIEALKAYYEQAIGAQERISHVVILGPMAMAQDADLTEALHLQGRGVVFVRPTIAPGNDSAALLKSAQAVLQQVTDLADRL